MIGSDMSRIHAAYAAQSIVGGLLLAAAWSKARDISAFVSGVKDYRVVPQSLATPTAVLVIVLEAALGLLHVGGVAAAFVVSATLGLFGCFGIALAINLRRGRTMPCHCMGHDDDSSLQTAALRLISLAMLEGISAYLSIGSAYDGAPITRPHAIGDVVEISTWIALAAQIVIWLPATRSLTTVVADMTRHRPINSRGIMRHADMA
jgi:hypothetical protein